MNNHKKNVKAGDVIMQQGDEGHSAYIIESGTVEILIEKDNGLVQSIGTRGEGTIIGEMSLVDEKPRSATIKAVEDCVLLQITRGDFFKRLESADPVIQMVMQVILTRYRDMLTRAHILGKPTDILASEELEKGLIQKANAVENLKTTNDLRRAIDNQELVLHYQPILDLQTREVKGFEGLIRWNHPEKGLIYPDLFIPIAEESGLIIDLTRQVVDVACDALRRLEEVSGNSNQYFMSLNFSSSDFSSPDFKTYMSEAIRKNNLQASQIHIEITERLLMNHPAKARDILEECRASGMVISIDDFGTGYSSLSYLHYFPIDILKIDRSFIINMEENESSYELVKSIIALGHNMGISIIAEGIENEAQAQKLQDLKVDKAQGYYFSRPLTEASLFAFIQETR